jgi:hypothetical protein
VALSARWLVVCNTKVNQSTSISVASIPVTRVILLLMCGAMLE